MEKKYTVFISSTYEDLEDERKGVADTILRAGDFPIGMEAFPAADEEQFEFIKDIIDECDYYILIVAGRYGSLAPDGLSYTEKEFDYAVQQDVPVLPLIHDKRETISAGKTEKEHPEKLEAFISKAQTGRMCKFWNTADGLKLAVRETLDHAKKTKARTGWIRSDKAISGDAAAEILTLKKENEALKTQINTQNKPVELNLKGLNDEVEVIYTNIAYKNQHNQWMGHDDKKKTYNTSRIKLKLEDIWIRACLLINEFPFNSVFDTVYKEIIPDFYRHNKVNSYQIAQHLIALELLEKGPTVSGYQLTEKGQQAMQQKALFYK